MESLGEGAVEKLFAEPGSGKLWEEENPDADQTQDQQSLSHYSTVTDFARLRG